MVLRASPPTVYVVDDDVSVRDSLSSLIRSTGLRVQAFESATAFLDSAPAAGCACLVLDVRMPEIDGFGLQKLLSESGNALPIIFVTGHGDVPLAVRAMKAGALEFLNKPFSDHDLLEAIEQALSRSDALGREQARRDAVQGRFDALTAREREVVLQVVQGISNKRVAMALGVSESTIKVHRHNIMLKMQVGSLPELTLALQLLQGGGSPRPR